MALLDVQQNRLRFRKKPTSVSIPACCGCWGKELVQDSSFTHGPEGPQPGVPGDTRVWEGEMKVTGFWLVPSPPLRFSFPIEFLFLWLFSPCLFAMG